MSQTITKERFQPLTCFRTFKTEAEAQHVKAKLSALRLLEPIALEYSDFVEKYCLSCHPDDARALYARSQQIAPMEVL